MPGPILFAGLPLLMAPVVFLLRRWRQVESVLAALVAALLAVLVLGLPLEQPIGWLGGAVIGNSATVMGRTLAVEPSDRLALAFVYSQAALLFLISRLGEVGRPYLPAGLAALGLLAAALFIRPLMFAALFLEMAACLAVFMLAGATSGRAELALGHPREAARAGTRADAPRPMGAETHPVSAPHALARGALRFLVFTTLGMPFILLTGWLLEASAASPDDPSFLAQATILLGIGSAVLIGVVPFHSWMPAVAEHTPPLASAFVFTVLRFAIIFLLLAFLDAFAWLGQNPAVYRAFTLGGGGLTLVGALFAFGQRNFGRTLGYAMMLDIGAVLLAVGLGTRAGVGLALAMLALRGMALPLWAIGLDRLRRAAAGSDDFDALRGLGRRYPFASGAVILGLLSLVGFPLTAGFPGRWALWHLLAQAPGGGALALLQFAGLVSISLVCARGLAALLTPPDVAPAPSPGGAGQANGSLGEGRAALAVYSAGFAVLLVLGLFPQWLLPAVVSAASAFSQIGP